MSVADEIRGIYEEAVAAEEAEQRQRKLEYRRQQQEEKLRLEEISKEKASKAYKAIIDLCKERARNKEDWLHLSCADIQRLSGNLWYGHFHYLFDMLRDAGFEVKEEQNPKYCDIIHCWINWRNPNEKCDNKNKRSTNHLEVIK